MQNFTLSTSNPTHDSGNDPNVTITVSPAPAAGQTIRFSLVAVDNNGIASQAAFVDVLVVALPVAVVTGPKAVGAGATITLDASGSTPKGQIGSFQWRLVPQIVVGPGTGGPILTGPITGGPILTNPNL